MSDLSGETCQLNLRVPSDTAGHLRTLAKEGGMKLHPYVEQKLWEHVSVEFLAIGREQFMDDLARQHQAETDLYTDLFDRLEAGSL